MLLSQAEALLAENKIDFEKREFASPDDFFESFIPFYSRRYISQNVTALVIKNNNDITDIRLEFIEENGEYKFCNMYFGDYDFELFDMLEGFLSNSIIDNISDIRSGRLKFISAYDIKHRRRLSSACYDMRDEFDAKQHCKALCKLSKRKSLLHKLLNHKTQYELFDWNSYRRIIK